MLKRQANGRINEKYIKSMQERTTNSLLLARLNQSKGYIFDLDGTLALTQNLHFLAFSKVFKEEGINYTQHDDQYKYSGTGSKFIFPAVFKENNKPLTPEKFEALSNKKKKIYDELLETEKIITVPGAEKFLEWAKQKGKKMIIATGNKQEATKKILQRGGISSFFEAIVSQEQVEHQKPAPDIFLLATKKLNLMPEECIVFEDGINGIKAAMQGNIPSIGLTTSIAEEDLKKAGASFIIRDYQEILV